MSTATYADRRLDVSISDVGGKGAFSKEIQNLVLAGEADIAVHSAKDLQAVTPEGLDIAAYCPRGDARDALVGSRLEDLGPGSRVATGSARRRALLADLVPGVEFFELRGNIATRLAKAADFDAIIMAATALERMGLEPAVVDILDPGHYVPQVGQGALAVEISSAPDADGRIAEIVAAIDDSMTRLAVTAEREFLAELGGDCSLPAGAHALVVDVETIRIKGVLADAEGGNLQRLTLTDKPSAEPGRQLARRLRKALEAATS